MVQKVIFSAFALLLSTSLPSRAAAYVEDFADGVADRAQLFGSAVVDNATLRLTTDSGAQTGSMNLNPLDPSAIESFTASFTLALGPGSTPPAEGFSFNFGQLPDAPYGEEGPASFDGLTIVADLFDNGGGEAPAIEVLVNGVLVPGGRSTQNPYTNGAFVPVTIRFDADGTLDMTIVGVGSPFTNLQTNFIPATGDRFGFGARTGTLTAEHRVDDIRISTVIPEPDALAIAAVASLTLTALGRHRGTAS